MTQKSQRKKVLIITYYWPPAGGPGVQRVLKFAKYLPEFGWEPIILTVKDGEYPAIDNSLIQDVDPDMKVFYTRSLEPFKIYKALSGQKSNSSIDNYVLKNEKPGLLPKMFKWIRFNLFIPDARLGWIPFATRKARQILKDENIDVIFSTSPPHSLQLTALRLARKSNLPWVADFRDPWSSIVYYQDESRIAFAQKLDQRWEYKVLTRANKVITISHEVKKDLDEIANRNDTEVIYNGFDSADFRSADFRSAEPFYPNSEIIVTYAGFLSDTRIPHVFLKVLSENLKKFKQIRFHIYGKTSPGFDSFVTKLKLDDKVIRKGYVDHSILVQRLFQSDALLMVVDNVSDNKGILTGKLFDYMGASRPIIAIGPKDGEVQKIVSESSSGWYIEYEEKTKMESCLEKLMAGKLDFQFNTQPYDRKNLTGKLAKILDSVHKKR